MSKILALKSDMSNCVVVRKERELILELYDGYAMATPLDLLGLDYVVLYHWNNAWISFLIAKVGEVVLGKDATAVVVRFDSLYEVFDGFPSKLQDPFGRGTNTQSFRLYGDVELVLDEAGVVPFYPRLDSGLTLKDAIRQIADTYLVNPSQVTISIREVGVDKESGN